MNGRKEHEKGNRETKIQPLYPNSDQILGFQKWVEKSNPG